MAVDPNCYLDTYMENKAIAFNELRNAVRSIDGIDTHHMAAEIIMESTSLSNLVEYLAERRELQQEVRVLDEEVRELEEKLECRCCCCCCGCCK